MEYFRYEVEESMDDLKWMRVVEVIPCPVKTEVGRNVEIRQFCIGDEGGAFNYESIQVNAACVRDLGRFLLQVSNAPPR